MMCKFMYRWYHKQKLPHIFFDMFTRFTILHDYAPRHEHLLLYPNVRTDYGKTRCSYRAPYIWNLVITKAKINPDTSEAVFAKSVKQCLKVKIL